MTDEEQRLLRNLHDALMKPRKWRDGYDRSLLSQLERMVEDWPEVQTMSKDWKRMGWAMRGLFAFFIFLGSLIVAWDKITAFLRGLAK